MWIPEFAIPVFIIPTAIVLIIATNFVFYNTPNSSTISLDSSATSYLFDGKLISSNKENTLKILPIDKVYDNTDIHISSSNLTEATSTKKITFNNIRFNGNISLSLQNMSTVTGPREVNVTILSNNPGLYHGTIQLVDTKNNSFVPVVVSIKPNLTKMIIFVLDGFVTGAGTLNVIGYVFLDRRTERLKIAAEAFVQGIYRSQTQAIVDNISYAPLKQSIESIYQKLQQSDIISAARELERLQIVHPEVTSHQNVTNLLAEVNVPQNLQNDYNTLIQRIRSVKFSIPKYSKQPNVVEKNIISGFISITFGLLVGFILLLQTDYIKNLTVIQPSDAVTLFLMGIGIGNLNEGIGKLWDGKNGA